MQSRVPTSSSKNQGAGAGPPSLLMLVFNLRIFPCLPACFSLAHHCLRQPRSPTHPFVPHLLSLITYTSAPFPARSLPSLTFPLQGPAMDKENAGRVVILDGSAVRAFATDEASFNEAVDPQFQALDVNGDGVLSRAELRPAFERLNLIDLRFGVPVTKTSAELTALYDSVFEGFDTDHNDTVDLKEFRSSLTQILLAIADGLGSAPLTMLVEDGSLLGNAADYESRHSVQARQIDAKDIPSSAVIQRV